MNPRKHSVLSAAIALLLSLPHVAEAADSFTKITTGPGSAGTSSSLAWGDYNNDGFPDLYVNALNGGQSLL
jgi:hypothetical protein